MTYVFREYEDLVKGYHDAVLLERGNHESVPVEDLPEERREQVTLMQKTIESLHTIPLSNKEKALILSGMMFVIFDSIRRSYLVRNPERSALCKALKTALDFSDTNMMSCEDKEVCVDAMRVYTKQQIYVNGLSENGFNRSSPFIENIESLESHYFLAQTIIKETGEEAFKRSKEKLQAELEQEKTLKQEQEREQARVQAKALEDQRKKELENSPAKGFSFFSFSLFNMGSSKPETTATIVQPKPDINKEGEQSNPAVNQPVKEGTDSKSDKAPEQSNIDLTQVAQNGTDVNQPNLTPSLPPELPENSISNVMH